MTTNPLPPVEALKVEQDGFDSPIERWAEWAKRDDWHEFFVGSDIRQMLGEISRWRAGINRLANRPEPASGDMEARAREMAERLRKYASGTEGNTTMMRDVAARLMYEAADLIEEIDIWIEEHEDE